MFLHQLLKDISELSDLEHYSKNYGSDSPYHLPIKDDKVVNMIDKPGCYGPFRHYFEVPNLEQNSKIILHLRDPRDVLTSMYFYLAYHQKYIPESVRQAYVKRGIDKFPFNPRLAEVSSWKQQVKYKIKDILGKHSEPTVAEWFLKDYQLYFEKYCKLDDIAILTYEEMVTDFPTWLPKFLDALSLGDNQGLRDTLIERHQDSFKVSDSKELEKISHKRKVTPGDHKNHMSPKTIAKLNSLFSQQINQLGYVP